MIVKIQRPLMTNGDEPMALIYNQSRSIEVQIPLHNVEQMFEEGEFKIFAFARVFNKNLILNKRAPDQDW